MMIVILNYTITIAVEHEDNQEKILKGLPFSNTYKDENEFIAIKAKKRGLSFSFFQYIYNIRKNHGNLKKEKKKFLK